MYLKYFLYKIWWWIACLCILYRHKMSWSNTLSFSYTNRNRRKDLNKKQVPNFRGGVNLCALLHVKPSLSFMFDLSPHLAHSFTHMLCCLGHFDLITPLFPSTATACQVVMSSFTVPLARCFVLGAYLGESIREGDHGRGLWGTSDCHQCWWPNKVWENRNWKPTHSKTPCTPQPPPHFWQFHQI